MALPGRPKTLQQRVLHFHLEIAQTTKPESSFQVLIIRQNVRRWDACHVARKARLNYEVNRGVLARVPSLGAIHSASSGY